MSMESTLFLHCSVTHADGQPLVGMRVSIACLTPLEQYDGLIDTYGQVWLWSPSSFPTMRPCGVPGFDGGFGRVTFHTRTTQYYLPDFHIDLELRPGADRDITLLIGPNGYKASHNKCVIDQLLLPMTISPLISPMLLPQPIMPPSPSISGASEGTDASDFAMDPKEAPLLKTSEYRTLLPKSPYPADFPSSGGLATVVQCRTELKRTEEHDAETEAGDYKRRRITIQGLTGRA